MGPIAQRLAAENVPNMLTSTDELIDANGSYIDRVLAKYNQVNIVDIGIGNALPVKNLLSRLIEQDKLKRYVALDFSPEMLKIAETNIQEWFGDKVAFEGHELDISYDRFAKVLVHESIQKDATDTVNVILFLGGTIENLRFPDTALRIIHESMGRADLFMHSEKLDTPTSRRYFEFTTVPGDSSISPHHRFFVDLLNIDEVLYDVEMGFDEQQMQRYVRIRLKIALIIKFQFKEGERLVSLNKGDTVLLFRYWHLSAANVIRRLEQNNFKPLQVSQTEDNEYIFTISRIK